jgi:phosphoribosylformylglycinamidine synthase
MLYKIIVHHKKQFRDRHGEHVRQDIVDSGITKAVPAVRFAQLYRIEGEITREEVSRIAAELLIDPVTESCELLQMDGAQPGGKKAGRGIEVWLRHGVTDTVAGSVVKAVKDLGIDKELTVKTGQHYLFKGNISLNTVRRIADKLLVNSMVQEYLIA